MLKKIRLIIKNIFNFSYLYYLVVHFFERKINPKIVKKIRKRTISSFKKNECLILETYDGSAQVTHPNCIIYNDQIYMVCTPYPYGMEEYENPSLYFGDSIETLKAHHKNPLISQGTITKHQYLSDPCLFFDEKSLYIFYRKTEYSKTNKLNQIYVYDVNKKSSNLVISSSIDGLMSPIVIKKSNFIFLYYITRISNGSTIKKCVLNQDFKLIDISEEKVYGIPEDFFVWHFDINYDDSILYRTLVLLRSKKNPNKFALYHGLFDIDQGVWKIEEKVDLPKKILKNYKFCYKSCYIPRTTNILLNYVDKKNRYCLTIIESNNSSEVKKIDK